MRFTTILAALLLAPAVLARRGGTPAAPVTKKNTLVPQWGFPYGWGLGPGVDAEGMEIPDDQKKVKEVKRVIKNNKKTELEPMPKTGWFRGRGHEHIDQVEKALDGME